MSRTPSAVPGRLVYSTARFERAELVAGELVRRPASEVHGKVPGTTLTLCGELADSWPKFWDTPFAHVRLPRCSGCVRALARRQR